MESARIDRYFDDYPQGQKHYGQTGQDDFHINLYMLKKMVAETKKIAVLLLQSLPTN